MIRTLLLAAAVALLAAGTALRAQTTILDFEAPATSTTFQYFGSTLEGALSDVIANPDKSGINTSDSVLAFVEPAGGQTFAGAFSNPVPTTPFDLTSNTLVCVDVWSPEAASLSVKLEESTTGAGNWLATLPIDVTNQWQQLCFNTTLPGEEDPSVVAAGNVYEKLVLFVGLGTSNADEVVTYIDNIVTEQGSTAPVDVTFAVDMSDYAGSFNTVYVSGTFNSFSDVSNPLADDDNDGVWTATFPLAPGAYEFIYQVDAFAAAESFSGTEECVVVFDDGQNRFVNRGLFVGDAALALDPVCWESCYACGEAVEITFEVGTESITVDPGGLYIAGGGNFGAPGTNPLSDPDGDGVYTITFERPRGFSSYYAFANGNCPDYSCKENLSGQACADPNNFNDRFFPPVTQDTTISTCYQQCTDVTACGAAPAEGMITFIVDMREYSEAFTTVYVGGQFNGFSPDANPLSDDDGDNIWETTALIAGGIQEYKFQVDQGNYEDLAVGGACTITTGPFTNRVTTVDGDATLGPVCFGSCEACTNVSTRELDALGVALSVFPTLTDGQLSVALAASGAADLRDARVDLLAATGQVLETRTLGNSGAATTLAFDLAARPAGVYLLRARVADVQGVVRVVRR